MCVEQNTSEKVHSYHQYKNVFHIKIKCTILRCCLIFLQTEAETCVRLCFKEHPVQWFFSPIIQKPGLESCRFNPRTPRQTLNLMYKHSRHSLHTLQRKDAAFPFRKRVWRAHEKLNETLVASGCRVTNPFRKAARANWKQQLLNTTLNKSASWWSDNKLFKNLEGVAVNVCT